MSDLVEFLRARLDEDEAVARQATEGPWIDEYSGETGQCVLPADARSTREYVARTQLYAAAFDAQHIARWDPARVLAEVAAKRAMIDALQGYEPSDQWHDVDDMGKRENNAAGTLRRMAQVYTDHPDFDTAWRLTPA